ncbi:alternate F1F0 ATPase, F1 subunit alpha [Dissulfurirhabdus thermomarina]|nr:alternate F1F0 ATPase, F1 subunit alpha [Dissulfurirhabdus thermomarina]
MLDEALAQTAAAFDALADSAPPRLEAREFGRVLDVGNGVARVGGVAGVRSQELLRMNGGVLGIAFNLDPGEVGVILLGDHPSLAAGSPVRRTGRVVDTPVGLGLLGRVLDATGRPLDGKGPVAAEDRWPVERQAPAIMDRAPVSVPLATGLKVVDAMVPIGRGQRELILGDRQTGKTTLALEAILNQRPDDVIGVYCAVGQRTAAVARVVEDLRRHGALDRCIVVVASGDDPAGLQFITPYAATTMAEYFVERGRDVLVVYDDLTHHAQAYRELSLLLRRPPGREAFPGDIFYIHSRLLERATRLREDLGGGSLTALPIAETEAGNLSAYIPTNLISITDGQVYLSPDHFQKGLLPAVDVGRSVSRVGGKAQLPAYRAVTGELRLAYAQFEELETFARFGTRLDDATRQALERGRRVREVLKQDQYRPLPPALQLAALLAAARGLFDAVPLDDMARAEELAREAVARELPETCARIEAGAPLAPDDLDRMAAVIRAALAPWAPPADAGAMEEPDARP